MKSELAFPVLSLRRWFDRRQEPEVPEVPEGSEQPAEWYDEAFSGSAHAEYSTHYSASLYYILWRSLVEQIPRHARVLEIGCGPGQLAQFIADRCGCSYIGFDFSPAAIEMARQRNPSLTFHLANALDTELLKRDDYDFVICTEVMEHISADRQVLARIRPRVRCLVTVPSFPYVSHVRHFKSKGVVSARYGGLFTRHRIEQFRLVKGSDRCYFLLDGIRNAATL